VAARRRGRSSRGIRRKKQNVEWSNASVTTPILLTTSSLYTELVPDAMAGLTLAPDFLVKRVVGTFTIEPQGAATASTMIGLAIFRSVHDATGVRETNISPLDTDVDVGSADILWQKQLVPEYGAPFDATALDLSMNLDIDLKTRGSLRKLDKRNGLFLVLSALVTARVQVRFKLRLLGALSI